MGLRVRRRKTAVQILSDFITGLGIFEEKKTGRRKSTEIMLECERPIGT